MFWKTLFVLVIIDTHQLVYASDCTDVPTSEGAMTLAHGASACAEPIAGEDVGQRFITCNNGNVLEQQCAGSLRYDTVSKGCNWPNAATCSFNAEPTPTPSANNGGTASSWTPAAVVTVPNNECNSDTCKLPDCFCYGASYTKVPQADTPQFVMLTFDDGVTAALYQQYYRGLFVDNAYNLTNPTGCKLMSTFYVINENTDYTKLKALADAGNEIASHTIHHLLAQGDSPKDYGNISAEINGMRDLILNHTGDAVLAKSVVGFRAPYLRVAGDVMFQVLRDRGFLYDTSIVNTETSQGRPPLWPFTLDYRVKSCVNPPCPTQSYPALWEVPLNGWVGDDNFGCGMIDGCAVGSSVFTATEQEWYNYYQRNFNDHFYKNKVPMHMFTHASMFLRSPGSFEALLRWLTDTLTSHKDVWLVTPKQVIDWMKNPQTNDQMIANKWGCK